VRHDAPPRAVVKGARVATPRALTAGQWDDPQQMYDATCGGCHGAGVGPHLLGQDLPEPYIQYVGRNGLRAMPPFRVTDYTDAELAKLATWINSQPASAPPAPVEPLPRPTSDRARQPAPVPVRDGSEGEALYAMCSTCHDQGAPPLRGRAFLEGHVKVVVRHGLRTMPAFPESRISDAGISTLAAWLNKQQRGAQ
jgi:mono/diheme cytochrome c family protein